MLMIVVRMSATAGHVKRMVVMMMVTMMTVMVR